MTTRCLVCGEAGVPVPRDDAREDCAYCGALHDVTWEVSVDQEGVSGSPIITLLEDDDD